ncbi:MAG: helix-turn-helix transcriptional regulator [Flavobacteriales bacterium]|nr:helix-turn-helix transcriptional regulator [Flavobacteriales bacterium]
MFLDTDAARTRKDVTVTLGVSDAYVTAYINGKRIPLSEANALLAKFGTSILAQP